MLREANLGTQQTTKSQNRSADGDDYDEADNGDDDGDNDNDGE